MSWLSRASRAARWSREEWRLTGEAWLALLWAWLALRRWALPDVLARVQQRARAAGPAFPAAPTVRAVQRAAHLYPMPMLCLPQSVALARLLAQRGQPCEVVIGARPEAGALEAHAWVELAGLPINSAADSAERHPVLLREAIG